MILNYKALNYCNGYRKKEKEKKEADSMISLMSIDKE